MRNTLTETAYPCHVPDRMLDDQLLTFDFPVIIKKIRSEDAWKNGDRNALTLLKNPSMRIVIIALHDKAEINFHQSGNIISVQVLEGNLTFQTGNTSVPLKPGSLLTLHENMKHSLTAVIESIFLLTIAICPLDKE